MSEAQSIQWFPGHMAKTRRKIKEILPLIDAVAEVVDARVPVSSRNPELLSLIGDKPLIILRHGRLDKLLQKKKYYRNRH